MCRNATGRSALRPLGDATEIVVAGNEMVGRMSIHQAMQHCLNAGYVAEQPATSLMQQHPRQQRLRANLGPDYAETHLWIGGYGHACAKPPRVW